MWLRAGPPIDLSGRRDEVTDVEALRAMTAELMAVLTAMVEGLRVGYPKRWSDDG